MLGSLVVNELDCQPQGQWLKSLPQRHLCRDFCFISKATYSEYNVGGGSAGEGEGWLSVVIY